jgi:CubicO group peptidase (beta-lactamase class C family)
MAFEPAAAQSAESVEEERAVGFVKAVQAGDASALEAFMYDNWAPAEAGDDRESRWKRVTASLTKRHSGLSIVGVTVDQPHRLTVITEEADGLRLRFIFDFEPQPPHRIVVMSVEAGDGPAGADLPPINLDRANSREKIAEALTEWFDQLATDDVFSGTALVAWRGEPVFRGAWGKANLRWDVPNQVDTRFDLGSINKSFTQIAIGQLVIEGKLEFDDTVAEHLPDYPNQDIASRITVRQLLEHTSGLGDIFTDEFLHASKAQYSTPQDFFPLFADKPLQFEPGTQKAYSNAGYMVLGAIIESVSRISYCDYITRRIFVPAGMINSGLFSRDEPVANVAEGYTRMGQEDNQSDLRSNVFMLPVRGNSAGSAHSTVDDLLAFDSALREYRLLPGGYTNWYFGGEAPTSDGEFQSAYGRATAGTGIAGGAPGVSASLESDGDLAVIVLSNYDAPIAESVARTLYRPIKQALSELE